MLCGLLGFVERGTLTQAALGLVVSETVLLAFMRCAPILFASDYAHNDNVIVIKTLQQAVV